jgi:hypothetical protein
MYTLLLGIGFIGWRLGKQYQQMQNGYTEGLLQESEPESSTMRQLRAVRKTPQSDAQVIINKRTPVSVQQTILQEQEKRAKEKIEFDRAEGPSPVEAIDMSVFIKNGWM